MTSLRYSSRHMQSLSNLLPYIQIVLSLALIGLILLQRPVSDSGAFGATENGAGHQKRGLELTIYRGTIVIGLLFIASAVYAILF